MPINHYEYIKKHYPNLTVCKATDTAKVIRIVTEKSNFFLDTSNLNLIELKIILNKIL